MNKKHHKAMVFLAQFISAIALAFLLGGVDASPAWVLCGAAIPCVLAIAAEAARRIGERHAIANGAELCDVAIDPLAPDWQGTAQGIIDVFSHAIVESRNVRMRFLPCGSFPYQVAVLPPKRNSVKPRLAVSPIAQETNARGSWGQQAPSDTFGLLPVTSYLDTKSAIEIPTISVRIPMPIEVIDSMATIWISPIGKRVRLLRCPPDVLKLEIAINVFVIAIAALLAVCGLIRVALLVALCLILRITVEFRSWFAPHILWLAVLVIVTMLFHDTAPSFFGDPLRVVIYVYVLPIALWRGVKRFMSLKTTGDTP